MLSFWNTLCDLKRVTPAYEPFYVTPIELNCYYVKNIHDFTTRTKILDSLEY